MKNKGFFLLGLLSLLAIALTPSFAGASDYLIWKNLSEMFSAKYGIGTAEMNGKIYAIGGQMPSGMPPGVTNYVGTLNTTSGTLSWYVRNPVPPRRCSRGFL